MYEFEARENIILSILNMCVQEKYCRIMLENHYEIV